MKTQPVWKKTLSHLFEEFYNALEGRDSDVIKVQYIFAYEKDTGCGQHFFHTKVNLRIIFTNFGTKFIASFLMIRHKLNVSVVKD